MTGDPGRLLVSLMRDGSARVSDGDAADCAEYLQAQVDRGVLAREGLAAQQGLKIACTLGCNLCCEEPVMIWRGEALAIARWLQLPENGAALAAFRGAYPYWAAKVGDSRRQLADLAMGGDQERYRQEYVGAWRLRVMCAFNDASGACGIYPVRPIVCRNNHALDTSEACSVDVERNPARIGFKPLDELLGRVRAGGIAVHHAAGGERLRPTALPDAVWALLPPLETEGESGPGGI